MTAAWLIAVLTVLFVLQMLVYRRWSLEKLSYQRRFSKSMVTEGETVEMIETLRNRKALPLPWIRIESKIDSRLQFARQENLKISDQFHCSVFFLGAFQKITRRHQVLCAHRGYFRLYQTSLTCGDLFGMNEKRMDLPGMVTLAVIPSIPDFTELPESAMRLTGELSARRWILPDPILISGIRGYQPSDDPKDIHWRATARTGSLQVKVRDFTVSPRLIVVLNVQLSEALWYRMEPEEQEQVEPAVRCAAALIDWAIGQGMEAGLITNSEMVVPIEGEFFSAPPKGGSAGHESLMLALAQLDLQRRVNFPTLLDRLCQQELQGADLAIVTPYWNDTLEQRRQMLLALGNTVSVVNLESEVVRHEGTTAAS